MKNQKILEEIDSLKKKQSILIQNYSLSSPSHENRLNLPSMNNAVF